MNKKEFKEDLEKNMSVAKECYLKNGMVLPTFVVCATKNKKKALITSIITGKDIVKKGDIKMFEMGFSIGVQHFLKKEFDSVESVFSISEAWLSLQKIEKEGVSPEKIIPASKDPNHEEVLIVSGMSAEKETVADIKVIRKKWENNKVVVSFEDLKDKKGNIVLRDGGIKIESNLLDSFWVAFNMIKDFSLTVADDKIVQKEFKEKSSEVIAKELFETFIDKVFD